LPQLLKRLESIQRYETDPTSTPESKGTIAAWGLENIAKLTYFYADPMQLSTMLQLLILFSGSFNIHEKQYVTLP
jgi:hypothetical protein